MENLNQILFGLLNAPEHPGALALYAAVFFAVYAILALPAIIGIGWMRGREPLRKLLLEGSASGLIGLTIAQMIGALWPHPRPFMIGAGHTFISHVADASFPSDHLTLMWAVAFSFLLHHRSRTAGTALALLGLPVAWARIYVGVHFPFDMAGAALVAVVSARAARLAAPWFIPHAYRLASYCHQRLFHSLIRRGWVQR